MTIECHKSKCPKHSCHTPGEEGPFCYEDECTEKETWAGSAPKKCDNCARPITFEFVDGKTKYGPWGILCMTCHSVVGVGLGIGKGQRYNRDGEVFRKVEG